MNALVKTAFRRLLTLLNGVGSLWIVALMVLINLDVFSRFLFNRPIAGVPEIVELSIVGIVFLQLGDATASGRLTRSDALFNRLLAALPRLGHMLGVLFDLAGVAFMALIVYGGMPRLLEAYERDYYVGTKGLFTAPVWPVRFILVLGCTLVAVQFLIFAGRHVAGILRPGAERT